LRNKILLIEQQIIEDKLNNNKYEKIGELQNINNSIEKDIEIKKQN
jgi:hypothetical protein